MPTAPAWAVGDACCGLRPPGPVGRGRAGSPGRSGAAGRARPRGHDVCRPGRRSRAGGRAAGPADHAAPAAPAAGPADRRGGRGGAAPLLRRRGRVAGARRARRRGDRRPPAPRTVARAQSPPSSDAPDDARRRDLAELYARYAERLAAAELVDDAGLLAAGAQRRWPRRPSWAAGLELVVVDGFSRLHRWRTGAARTARRRRRSGCSSRCRGGWKRRRDAS